MKTARIFKTGRSQAVRIPKEFRIEGDTVFIKKEGNRVILIPVKESWDALMSSLDKFSEDSLSERVQPDTQSRQFLLMPFSSLYRESF